MKTDSKAAIKFLKKFNPEGPWILTSIDIDVSDRRTTTDTFTDEGEATAWITDQNREKNVYFTVNETRTPIVKQKPSKTAFGKAGWLYVDVDPVNPPKEYDETQRKKFLKDEQERIKAALTENKNVPKPTLIIYSGGGYQAFWKLRDAFDIDGQESKWQEFEQYNKQLETVFNGDHCFNVDRIMRLPGTVNHPDAKKRAKGREPAMAAVESFNSFLIYPIDKFKKKPMVQNAKDKAFLGDLVQISGNIQRFPTIESISPNLGGRAGVVIAQGLDPENPGKFESRSEWLFYVVCEMVRCECDDDTIYSVITDPEWGISESVLVKGSAADKYAIRQITRAREVAINPDLAAMNEKYAVIKNMGGKCLVVSRQHNDSLKRDFFTTQDFTNFKQAYCNQMVDSGIVDKNDNPKFVAKGDWWIKHQNRRQYETLTFVPGVETHGSYNMWQGWAYEASNQGSCELFLDHIRDNICKGNTDYYKYLMGWMARTVQHPNSPGKTCIVFRGEKGVGKSFVAEHFGKLAGHHFLSVADSDSVVGHFNDHLRDCLILFADEAFFAGDKKNESQLKKLITQDALAVTAKYGKTEQAANYLHIIMASNEDWVVPASGEERRYFVLDVSRDKLQDLEYFGMIAEELENGGYEALLHYLLNYDLSDFDVWKCPKTESLQMQKVMTLTPIQQWWYAKLNEGVVLNRCAKFAGDYIVEELVQDFKEYTNMFGGRSFMTKQTFGTFMNRVIPGKQKTVRRAKPANVTIGGRTETIARPRYYMIPTLDEARLQFDKSFGGPFPWEDTPIDMDLDGNEPF